MATRFQTFVRTCAQLLSLSRQVSPELRTCVPVKSQRSHCRSGVAVAQQRLLKLQTPLLCHFSPAALASLERLICEGASFFWGYDKQICAINHESHLSPHNVQALHMNSWDKPTQPEILWHVESFECVRPEPARLLPNCVELAA